jgi:YVTN family beta-propeller protein
MRARWLPKFLLVGSVLLTAGLVAAVVATGRPIWIGAQRDGSVLVPTGQRLTPAGDHIEVNDRPLGMVISPSGDLVAVVTGSNFNPRALHIVDAASRTLKQTLPIGDSFVGVDFSPDGKVLYVGGGRNNDVKIFALAGGLFAPAGSIPIPGSAPSGLDVSADGARLYVALNTLNRVAVIDTAARNIVAQIPVGTFPYTTVISADGSKVYVSNWGGRVPGPTDFTDGMFPVVVDRRTGIPVSGTVSVINTATNAVEKTIEVGLHPCGMALGPGGDHVYVTNANSDTVSVIDTATDTVTKTLNVRAQEGWGRRKTAPVLGSSPNAVAAGPDGRRLYVANAAENAIAVLDPRREGTDAVLGLIPTGWYPTAVAVTSDGRQLYVASGYGFGSIAPTPPDREGRSYRDRLGVISILDAPDPFRLWRLTRQVRQNNRSLPPDDGNSDDGDDDDDERDGGRHPIPVHARQRSPIKHVFYIIKENRTYDQVFGALPQGNGDPSLVEFGRDVTPNHHALAERYVLLDNFYGPGDQSALGHRWCLQAYPSTWTHKYGNARNNQSPMLLGPTEAIYDNAKAHGLSVRAYGERGLNTFTPANATWTDVYNDWKNGTRNVRIVPQAVIVGLRDIYHPEYPAYDMRVPDQYRADIFLREFAEFEKNGRLPNLNILLLPQDHTEGTDPEYPTPRATVADNDLALGRIVAAISRSRYWRESAIFVTEDDSQDGVDHVDGHRTVGLVISPYVKRGVVDSTFYTIINMYRTMQQILGLPPRNQFDLAAQPMFSVFTSKPDFRPYTALPNQIPIDEMNPPLAGLTGLQRQLAEFSMRIERSEPDASDADLLNRAIWHSVKGYGTPYNHGRPMARRYGSFLSLLQLAGS